MHLPLRDGSPPDPARLKARSADGSVERRRERWPSADGLLPPRPALAWLAVAAAIFSTTLAAFSLLTPCGGSQASVLELLRSSFSFGEEIDAGNSSTDGVFRTAFPSSGDATPAAAYPALATRRGPSACALVD